MQTVNYTRFKFSGVDFACSSSESCLICIEALFSVLDFFILKASGNLLQLYVNPYVYIRMVPTDVESVQCIDVISLETRNCNNERLSGVFQLCLLF